MFRLFNKFVDNFVVSKIKIGNISTLNCPGGRADENFSKFINGLAWLNLQEAES